MQLIKDFNGAITLKDVLESHPVIEELMYELHHEEANKINKINVRNEAASIQKSMRGR